MLIRVLLWLFRGVSVLLFSVKHPPEKRRPRPVLAFEEAGQRCCPKCRTMHSPNSDLQGFDAEHGVLRMRCQRCGATWAMLPYEYRREQHINYYPEDLNLTSNKQ